MERPVLVTTQCKRVFFGYATNTEGKTIRLRAARRYFPGASRRFVSLARDGPLSGEGIGPPADTEVKDISFVTDCSRDAVDAWERA